MSCCIFFGILGISAIPFLAAILLRLYAIITQFWCTSAVCLSGKVAMVTGGSEGIGYEIAIALASRGCRVIVADKAVTERGREEMVKITHNPNISFEYIDLASFKSVRDFAERIKKTEQKLDILINNAGMGSREWMITEDGLHVVLQVNYHSPFLLTHLLVDLLKKSETGGRVIFTTSLLAYIHFMSSPEEVRTLTPGPKVSVYGKSKYLQIVCSDKLAEKLKPYNITSNSWHPLVVYTNIFQFHKPYMNNIFSNITVLVLLVISFITKTPVEGAQTGIYLACADEVKRTTGEFFAEGVPTRKPGYTKEFQEKVWKYSEEAVKMRPEERL